MFPAMRVFGHTLKPKGLLRLQKKRWFKKGQQVVVASTCAARRGHVSPALHLLLTATSTRRYIKLNVGYVVMLSIDH